MSEEPEASNVHDLDAKELAQVATEAREAGIAARLAWATDNAPITAKEAPGNAHVVALWLLTTSGKVGREKVTFEKLYKNYFENTTHTGNCYVYYYPPKGRGMRDRVTTFNKRQLKGVNDLAIILANGLCARQDLDEVHEVSQAHWVIEMESVAVGSGYGSLTFTCEKSSRGRVDSDDMLISALKARGFASKLSKAYSEGYPDQDLEGYDDVKERRVKEILEDPDRAERLRKKGVREVRYQKAASGAKTAVGKLKSTYEWLSSKRGG